MIINRRNIIFILAIMISLAGTHVFADIYVISHVDVEVSAEDIKDIYLGRKEYAKDQQHLIPVQNAAARKEFMSQVLRMKSKRYRIYWAKKSFQDGTMTPQMKMNDKETIQYIMHTPGAIGYTKTKPEGVKIIKKY